MRSKSVNTKNLLKFILGSAFGILMFLVPIPQGESFTTLLDFIKGFLKKPAGRKPFLHTGGDHGGLCRADGL